VGKWGNAVKFSTGINEDEALVRSGVTKVHRFIIDLNGDKSFYLAGTPSSLPEYRLNTEG